MTDKVQKIREEVERLRKSYQIMYQELDCELPELIVCAKRNLCQDILMFIDSLQEDPKFKVGDVIQKKDDNSIRYSIINRTDDTYRALRGLSETIVIWFSEQDQWELVEESIDYNKLNTMLDDSLEKETPESWNEMLKEDTTHRTKADVDAAMADVEEKAKAFTEAHKGETADEILAGMRGEEPIIGILSRYLDHASKEEAMEVKSAIDRWFSEYFPESVSEELEEEIGNYVKRNGYDGLDSIEEVKYIANHFANWQKQQLMKKAIEGIVTTSIDGWINVMTGFIRPEQAGANFGDKVKLITIKED